MVDEESDLIAALGRNMTPSDKQFKDAWIREYVFDYNGLKASNRVGLRGQAAKNYAKKALEDQYVLLHVKHHKLRERTKDDLALVKNQAEAAFYDVMTNPYAQSAARVSAAKSLLDLHGLNAPKKSEVNVNHGGRVMVVPAIASIESWEKAAAESQDKLVQEARTTH